MKAIKRTFYSDPGHGWLCVNYAELEELGIQDKISPWSYRQNGKIVGNDLVYLEEDCDAGVYINAVNKLGYTVEFVQKRTDQESPIRSYDPYYFQMGEGELIAKAGVV